MPIEHKFLNRDFGNGFITKNAILETTPYEPEVLFIGTFNPLVSEDANMAEFYYGRNWFWPCMFNIFHYKAIHYNKKRVFSKPSDPSLEKILQFCQNFRITFADLISQVCHNDNIHYELCGKYLSMDGINYDLISDNDLAKLNNLNQVEWSTEHIIKYISNKKSLKLVYFTRQPKNPYKREWDLLVNHDYGNRVIGFKNIYTPSGQGMGKDKPKMNHLIHRWLFQKSNMYDCFQDEWLIKHNVDKQIFNIP